MRSAAWSCTGFFPLFSAAFVPRVVFFLERGEKFPLIRYAVTKVKRFLDRHSTAKGIAVQETNSDKRVSVKDPS
ncbi:MAG: hypothetical protein DRH56_04860 [Deltaproteobacteria bacterium]|nr:MAG: hypothetical protein DRH56_04860 [Deltaproteobacteria bacterium]